MLVRNAESNKCLEMEDEIDRQEIQEEKSARLSLHLICKRHLPTDAQKWGQDKIVEALNLITHLRLDRERLAEIDSLELLGDLCTNIYLQHNRIEKIQNLECLKNLTFITLANNRIREIENLGHLRKLVFLDLSENQISTVDKNEIPSSVIILNLQGNPCTKYPNYSQEKIKQTWLANVTAVLGGSVYLPRLSLYLYNRPIQWRLSALIICHWKDLNRLNMIRDIPKLKQLDLCAISSSEKRDVGLDVSSDEDDDESDEEEVKKVVNKGTEKFESFQTISAEMMLRSQRRAEDSLQEHKIHTSQLDDLRISWNVPPSSRSTARSNAL